MLEGRVAHILHDVNSLMDIGSMIPSRQRTLRHVVSVFAGAPCSFSERGDFHWFMPKRLKRIYGFGHLHFITFSCYRRLPLLASSRARNVFVRVLDQVRKEYGFKLVGYVVMPEHVHLAGGPGSP